MDDAEWPPYVLLADMREAVAAAAYNATIELDLGGKHAIVRASSDKGLDAAYGKCAAVHARAREDARKPPSNWAPNWMLSAQPDAGASFVLTPVDQWSNEWFTVAHAVQATMFRAEVTRLERVQNKALWDKYAQRRAEVAKESADGFSANEVWGFHGTRDFSVAKVCENGLDFRYGNNGMWGRALYLAANACYSHHYASNAGNGERQFFYVRAALGRTKEMDRDSSLRAPPNGFDSVNGMTQGHRVCMLYDLGQAYPEYIVTYRHD